VIFQSHDSFLDIFNFVVLTLEGVDIDKELDNVID
jgi:hypothetical protein